MWDVYAIAASAAAQAQQVEFYRQSARQQYQAYMNQLAPYVGMAKEPKHESGKCPCCGSRQFQYHNTRRICSYCRSEQ